MGAVKTQLKVALLLLFMLFKILFILKCCLLASVHQEALSILLSRALGRELSEKTAPNRCTESHLRINLTYLKGFSLLLFVSTKNRPSCVFA